MNNKWTHGSSRRTSLKTRFPLRKFWNLNRAGVFSAEMHVSSYLTFPFLKLFKLVVIVSLHLFVCKLKISFLFNNLGAYKHCVWVAVPAVLEIGTISKRLIFLWISSSYTENYPQVLLTNKWDLFNVSCCFFLIFLLRILQWIRFLWNFGTPETKLGTTTRLSGRDTTGSRQLKT